MTASAQCAATEIMTYPHHVTTCHADGSMQRQQSQHYNTTLWHATTGKVWLKKKKTANNCVEICWPSCAVLSNLIFIFLSYIFHSFQLSSLLCKQIKNISHARTCVNMPKLLLLLLFALLISPVFLRRRAYLALIAKLKLPKSCFCGFRCGYL